MELSRCSMLAFAQRTSAWMNPFKPLTTPEYLFRPRQIVHRFQRALRRGPLNEFEIIRLPWGSQLRVRPTEVIGANIWSYGVFDLIVTETVCRLLEESETALDIGANIGQMTVLMRHKAGIRGKVIAFEPHPEIFSELEYNVQTLGSPHDLAPVTLHNLALSDKSGKAHLDVGSSWAINRGLSKLVSGEAAASPRVVEVKTITLDEVLGSEASVGVCKLDVEAHELVVLKGAAKALGTRRIRDIVFEDGGGYPGEVHTFLQERGYIIFSLHSKVLGPRLVPAAEKARFEKLQDGLNYLATLDPQRAIEKLKPRGWRSLGRIDDR